MSEWFFPMTLLPGVGLLIMSTSNLDMGLRNEVAMLLHEPESNPTVIKQKIKQLSRLNLSLTAFYISCATLVMSGLISGIGQNYGTAAETGSELFLYFSILCIFVALILLMIYSGKAVKIKRRQFEERL